MWCVSEAGGAAGKASLIAATGEFGGVATGALDGLAGAPKKRGRAGSLGSLGSLGAGAGAGASRGRKVRAEKSVLCLGFHTSPRERIGKGCATAD